MHFNALRISSNLCSKHPNAAACLLTVSSTLFGAAAVLAQGIPQTAIKDDGTILVPSFELPLSNLLTDAERAAFKRWQASEKILRSCVRQQDISAQRSCIDASFLAPLVDKQKGRYRVRIQSETISGVNAEIFTPIEGVSIRNSGRVLINLHGGAFVFGAHYAGQIESIPIAVVGKIEVISIDYRMAPKYTFPSASKDVAAVYRALLKNYRAENIGIFGCSAGGVLTAQAVAWIREKEQLPRPGAVGMLCAGASYWTEGDSGHFSAATEGGTSVSKSIENPYLKYTDSMDPLAFPALSQQSLKQFPPSLLVSSTRDLALSSVVHTHSQLVKLGVETNLHVWEGVDHAFFYDPDLPQSREVYDVIVRFFDKYLGR